MALKAPSESSVNAFSNPAEQVEFEFEFSIIIWMQRATRSAESLSIGWETYLLPPKRKILVSIKSTRVRNAINFGISNFDWRKRTINLHKVSAKTPLQSNLPSKNSSKTSKY